MYFIKSCHTKVEVGIVVCLHDFLNFVAKWYYRLFIHGYNSVYLKRHFDLLNTLPLVQKHCNSVHF